MLSALSDRRNLLARWVALQLPYAQSSRLFSSKVEPRFHIFEYERSPYGQSDYSFKHAVRTLY